MLLNEYSILDTIVNKIGGKISSQNLALREKTSILFDFPKELSESGIRNLVVAKEGILNLMSLLGTDTNKSHLSLISHLIENFKKERTDSIAKELQRDENIVYFNGNLQKYNTTKGCYEACKEEDIIPKIKTISKVSLNTRECKEIVETHKTLCKIDDSNINLHRIDGLINSTNGMIKISEEEIELIPHSPEYYSTCCLGTSYIEDSDCPIWLSFLSETFEHYGPEKNKAILLLREIMGYMLIPGNKYQKLFYFYGKSRSGKSVIGHIISKLLGDENVSSIPFESLNDEQKIAELSSKLLNLSGELPRGVKIQSARIKSLVGEDKIQGRKLYSSPFDFINLAKIMVIGNNFATFDDNSGAILERIVLLTFETQVPEEKRNANLKNILEQELSGIFRWALNGLITLNKRGRFDEPQKNIEAKDHLEKKSDTIFYWLSEADLSDFENEIKGNTLKTTFKKFYQNYKDWCKEYHIDIEKRDEFKMRLSQESGIKVYKDTSKNQDCVEICLD